ncbi:MAG: DUF4348 domain-containing protein [Prevotella sp.]|jgi:hypothetical protein
MRKYGFLFLIVLFASAVCTFNVGCSDKKPVKEDSVVAGDTVAPDTLSAEDSVIAEQPMPKAADELFDDFFFNFAANRKLQRERIVFPLKVYKDGKLARVIQKKEWRMEHFFMRQDYYTLIFDSQKQAQLVKDTSVSHVVVEKISLTRKKVKQYIFDRINGQFRMTSINIHAMHKNNNASFLLFYQRFATDTAFQIRSMADEVTFTSPNPDNDFENQTGVILPEQWPFFKPALIPSGEIYNIIYGQTYRESNYKLFIIRGIANGQEIDFTFRRYGKHWKLIKFTT